MEKFTAFTIDTSDILVPAKSEKAKARLESYAKTEKKDFEKIMEEKHTLAKKRRDTKIECIKHKSEMLKQKTDKIREN